MKELDVLFLIGFGFVFVGDLGASRLAKLTITGYVTGGVLVSELS